MTSPKSITTTRSHTPITTFIWCSISSTVSENRSRTPNELHQLTDLERVHPGSGFVQQENPGARRNGAGDLQFPLIAVRQVSRKLLPPVLEGKDREILFNLLPRPPLLPVERTGPEQGGGGSIPDVRVVRDAHVVHHRQLPEEADVLEGPRDPPPSDHVRRKPRDLRFLQRRRGPGGRFR